MARKDKESNVPYVVPSGPDDIEGIKSFTREILPRGRRLLQPLYRDVLRNVLYYAGAQWINWDPSLRTWRPLGLKRFVPRPVTNKFRTVLNPLMSMLLSEDVPVFYDPATDQEEDVATASVSSRIVEIIEKETELDAIKPEMAKWLILGGNVFLISGAEASDEFGTTFVQSFRCSTCSAVSKPLDIVKSNLFCPQCKTPSGFTFATDEHQNPIGKEFPKSRIFTEVASPLEMVFDLEARSFEQSVYKFRLRRRSLAWLKQRFGKKADKVVVSPPAGESFQKYLETLAYATARAGFFQSSRAEPGDQADVVEGWYRTSEVPKGIYWVMVGDEILHNGPYPYHTITKMPTEAIVHLGLELFPGRVLHRSPADDLVPKQRFRNELEALARIYAAREAGSILAIPEGSNITKISGEGGQIIRYTPVPGASIQRLPGGELPRTIFLLMEQTDADMEAIAGTQFVLKGEVPPRVEAFSAIQLLGEKAVRQHAEMITNWHLGMIRLRWQWLGIFKEYGLDERTHVIMGDLGKWAVSKFSGADLRGGINIRADVGLGRPRSHTERRAIYEQAVRLGLVNPLNEIERYTGLQILGLPELMKDFDMDRQVAAQENDEFLDLERTVFDLPVVRPGIHDPVAHIVTHRRLVLSDRFKELPQERQQIIMLHVSHHIEDMLMRQQAQAQQKPFKPSGGQSFKSEGEMVKAEGGAASQPDRLNELLPQDGGG